MGEAKFPTEFLSVMARMGARPDLTDRSKGQVQVNEYLSSNGIIRVAPLMLLADTVVGMRLESSIDDWTFTTDFSFRRGEIVPSKTIEARSTVLRHGKRLLIEELEYVNEQNVQVGHAHITFIRTPLREGETKPDVGKVRDQMGRMEVIPLEQSIEDLAGITIEDASTGRVSMIPQEAVRRPGGFVQGAIMTLIGELSAQVFAENQLGKPCVITGLDARYLIGGRSGPLTTSATWIGPPERGFIQVTLNDEGHDNISCVFLAQVEPC
ncbi:MAG: hypothetical protein QF596_08260 [Acidimicrobiales bacterium]|jgi:acyl-coenzyme A thioesterase PaaI-like protein|nr:hypothetical protein [Acidimicrobiales bacterium]MDP6299101.1 hypothetical protein [Acidimicrobiales bacterium]HJM28003.1 hypothetical protein [Acidimicrobiales bacterium]HJM97380.1 hypothetical protein [Acidimicrobiales bacterium]